MFLRLSALLILFFTFTSHSLFAQNQQRTNRYTVGGVVFGVPATADSAASDSPRMQPQEGRRPGSGGPQGEGRRRGEPLEGVNVALLSASDSTLITGAISGQMGVFMIPRILPGEYLLVASYIGYAQTVRPIQVAESDLVNVFIRLTEDPLQLSELQITGLVPRVEVRGDTTAFNADAYQVNPDATAEELVRRMPGITVENGRVTAQGEEVRRVLVDGAEFFGDDALVALRNLPAEIVQQVQLFDRQSDQAAFTGFDDGNAARTLNIVTRSGRSNGQFGRGGVSAGTNNRYMASGNMNSFNGARRISILGLSNNINQQNFSGEDLSGVAEASQSTGGRGGMGGGMGGWGGGNPSTRNFLTGSNSGINTTNSFGVNYIDRWGERTRINSSYFFSNGNNTTNTDVERVFLSEVQQDQLYEERVISGANTTSHRFNGRIDHTVNRRNSFIITPTANVQLRDTDRILEGQTTLTNGQLINRLVNNTDSESINMSFNNSILWRHSFPTRGRTFSANLDTRYSEQNSDENQQTGSFFTNPDGPILFVQPGFNSLALRQTETLGRTTNVGLNFQFTEPVSETAQLQLSLAPSYESGESRRDPFLLDPVTGLYTQPDLTQISFFNEQVFNNRTGVGYRKRGEKFNYNINADYQLTIQQTERVRPAGDDITRTYHTILPSAGLRYSFTRSRNLFVNYRMGVRNPSASQLQDVPNISNPLQVTAGNSNLDQQASQNITARYRAANTESGTSFFVFLNASYNTDVIGNNTFVATRDTLLFNGVQLGRGARFSRPENIGDSYSIRSFMNYSMPLKFISSNINFFSGVSFSTQPTINNNLRSDTQNTTLNAGTSVTSNISPRVEFTATYRANYSFLDNPAVTQLNTDYYTGNGSLRVNLLPWGKLLISSDLNVTHYSGISGDLAQNSYFWSGAIGYKFLKENAAEVRLSVVDILGENRSLNRSVSDDYYEDVRSNVISRFALLTVSYNFRRFGS